MAKTLRGQADDRLQPRTLSGEQPAVCHRDVVDADLLVDQAQKLRLKVRQQTNGFGKLVDIDMAADQ